MDGQVAIVTGAAKGIGKAMSEALLGKGVKVCLADIDENEGQKTCAVFGAKFNPRHVIFTKCDVTSEKDMEALFKVTKAQFGGRIDIVVNNAGICHEGAWERMIDINVKGVIKGTQLAIEHMRKDKGGSGGVVITTCSVAALHPSSVLPVYSATKSAILAYTRSICSHPSFKSKGVRVNCLCPIFVNTELINVDETMVHGLELARSAIEHVGVISVEEVVRVFMRVCESEEYNGKAFFISGKGVRIVPQQFPKYKDLLSNNIDLSKI